MSPSFRKTIGTAIWPLLVVVGIGCLTAWAARLPADKRDPLIVQAGSASGDLQPVVDAVNAELARLQQTAGIMPSDRADELTILRRLSLALHGTIPSLEEIRAFEADQTPDRIDRWLTKMFEDERFPAYFAERLARAYVGVEQGQFAVFRRDRFTNWLRSQLREQVPYDQTVRAMISGDGIWTGEGAANFVTAAFADDNYDPNVLTARATRAVLGQRIDCAQCHDHPFDHWKQSEFEGLTAYFGQVHLHPLAGVVDHPEEDFVIAGPTEAEDRVVAPSVPFHSEWLGTGETRREQLGNWLTHPENERFGRATANRVWALMFGEPFAIGRPVDDLPDPGTDSDLAVLDILGEDFRTHDYDLRRMVRVIAGSQAFQQTSQRNDESPAGDNREVLQTWSTFPIVRLRPEQVVGSMMQAFNVQTVDLDSHFFVRMYRLLSQKDFVDEFGDPGADELEDRTGSIAQALLRMNGKLPTDLSSWNPFFATGRVGLTGSSPENIVETVFLLGLTRRPEPNELAYFQAWVADSQTRGNGIEDLYWTLFNSPEFSWNH